MARWKVYRNGANPAIEQPLYHLTSSKAQAAIASGKLRELDPGHARWLEEVYPRRRVIDGSAIFEHAAKIGHNRKHLQGGICGARSQNG